MRLAPIAESRFRPSFSAMTTELITVIVAVAVVVVGLALGLAWWMNHTPNVRRNVDGRLPLFGAEYDPDHPREPAPRATPAKPSAPVSPEARAILAERAAAYGAADRRPGANVAERPNQAPPAHPPQAQPPFSQPSAGSPVGNAPVAPSAPTASPSVENADVAANARAAAKAAIRDLDLASLEASLSTPNSAIESEPTADSSVGASSSGSNKKAQPSSSILEFKTSHRAPSRAHPPKSPTESPVTPLPVTPLPVTPQPTAPAAANSAVVSNTGVPGTMVEGQLLRFSVPAEGTLQFLPGRLEIAAGLDAGREIRFVNVPGPDGTIVTFGRSEGELYRHIQLRDQTVSRSHARMRLIDARWHLLNLSQTNPVVHNGRVLANGEERPLDDGDRIEMGEVLFTFRSR